MFPQAKRSTGWAFIRRVSYGRNSSPVLAFAAELRRLEEMRAGLGEDQ